MTTAEAARQQAITSLDSLIGWITDEYCPTMADTRRKATEIIDAIIAVIDVRRSAMLRRIEELERKQSPAAPSANADKAGDESATVDYVDDGDGCKRAVQRMKPEPATASEEPDAAQKAAIEINEHGAASAGYIATLIRRVVQESRRDDATWIEGAKAALAADRQRIAELEAELEGRVPKWMLDEANTQAASNQRTSANISHELELVRAERDAARADLAESQQHDAQTAGLLVQATLRAEKSEGERDAARAKIEQLTTASNSQAEQWRERAMRAEERLAALVRAASAVESLWLGFSFGKPVFSSSAAIEDFDALRTQFKAAIDAAGKGE